MTNNGTINPGTVGGAGTLTINGAYSGSGSITLDIGGTTVGSYDVLAVTGNASLSGGTLNADSINGFTPAQGNAFQPLTYGSHSGTFGTVNLNLGGGNSLLPSYGSSSLSLTEVPTGTTVYWTDGTGNWTTATDWSTGATPGSSDVVYIGSSGNVTYNSGTSTIAGLNVAGTFTLSGGTLTDNGTLSGSGSITLSGGTLSGATEAAGTTITGTYSGGTFSSVTLNGTLDLATNGGTVTVINGLTLNGTANLGNQTNTSTSGQLSFSGGNETVGGNGTITFGVYSSNSLFSGSSGTVTLGNGILIDGIAGQVYGNQTLTIDSGITITASSAAAYHYHRHPPTFINNQGMVEAINGTSLSVPSVSPRRQQQWHGRRHGRG